MTTLDFDAGYAAFHSDSALFGQRSAISAMLDRGARLATSGPAAGVAAVAGRAALALMPFSALAWMFVAR